MQARREKGLTKFTKVSSLMRVSILTQPLGHNYGGLLQAYALQVYLKRIGCDVETLDRRVPVEQVTVAKGYIINLVRFLLGRIKSIPTNRKQSFVLQNLADFRDKNLVLSKRITSEIQLRDYFFRNKFEAVIVGSDQVWRPMYSPSILNFYLDFLNDIDSKPIRVAYAASFGVSEWEYPEDVTEKCRPLIKKFDAVSVREKSAVDLCKSKLGITSDWVVDPTLLLDPSDYEELIDQEAENPHKSLVLSYILDASKDKQQIATAVAEILQTDFFHIKPEKSISEVRSNDLGQCVFPRVETWLRSFRDASFVVTDSFHGSAFAILFNRPFVAVGNSKRGMARFESLLSMFGLEHRLVETEDDITPDLINKVIDWDKVNGLRERFAREGKLFLKNYLFSEKVNG